jgi:hypothetical protein
MATVSERWRAPRRSIMPTLACHSARRGYSPRRVAEPDGFRVMLDAAPAPRHRDIPDANFVL